jgi:hypothetical protein
MINSNLEVQMALLFGISFFLILSKTSTFQAKAIRRPFQRSVFAQTTSAFTCIFQVVESLSILNFLVLNNYESCTMPETDFENIHWILPPTCN